MSFDAHKILVYAWPPTYRLPSARFSADLKQLQNRDFSTSNRSKPIRVLTRTQSSCSDDRLPIGYLLPDFQPIWRNFFDSLFFFTTRKEGGRHLGGASAPPNPPGGVAPITPCIILLTLRQIWARISRISRISVISWISRKSRKSSRYVNFKSFQVKIALNPYEF